MMLKKLLFILFFCVFLSKITAMPTEEDMRNWQNSMMKKYHDECGHTISEESKQELEDSIDADNGEIRTWRCCVLNACGYVDGGEVRVKRIIDDMNKNGRMTLVEMKNVETILDLCKTEAEESDNKIDVAGRFINCIQDRFRSSE